MYFTSPQAVYTVLQGMQYVPNKLEQYAESVILAVSTEHDIVYTQTFVCIRILYEWA